MEIAGGVVAAAAADAVVAAAALQQVVAGTAEQAVVAVVRFLGFPYHFPQEIPVRIAGYFNSLED